MNLKSLYVKIVDESILFFYRVSLSIFSLEALNISWVWGVFILEWEWNAKSQDFQNRAGWRLGLATWLSREFKLWANRIARLDFLSCSAPAGMTIQLLACLARVLLLVAYKPRATCEIQSWVLVSLHNLKHFFTLSHTLPLHDSHLNTALLITKIQVNLAWNKANKMVDKIQPYNKDQNALHAAVESGGWTVIGFFRKRPEFEGLINEKDEEGNMPMHLAAINGDILTASQLVEVQCVVLNATNKEGYTPLDNVLLREKLNSWKKVCPFCPTLLNAMLVCCCTIYRNFEYRNFPNFATLFSGV